MRNKEAMINCKQVSLKAAYGARGRDVAKQQKGPCVMTLNYLESYKGLLKDLAGVNNQIRVFSDTTLGAELRSRVGRGRQL